MRIPVVMAVLVLIPVSFASGQTLTAERDALIAQSCTPDATTLCLLGNRFEIDVAWMHAPATFGDGQAVAMTDDWGYFWYTDPRYIDAAIKVLDGCGINARFWVFGTLLSDYQQTLSVRDVNHAVIKTYFNPLDVAPSAITDTDAFTTCGSSATAMERIATAAAPSSLELAGHFQINVDWRDFGGGTGAGNGVSLTSHSGYFWFFSPDNPELFIKLVDDYAGTGNFWVVFGATTNVEFTVYVTNTENGQLKSYYNPLGATPSTVIDRQAFVSSTVFSDAFESGDTTAWSRTVP